MSNTHPIMVLAFVLLGAVTVAHVSYLASAPAALPPDVVAADAGSAHGGAVATPNHDPHRPLSLMQSPTLATVATPNHDPRRARPVQQPTEEAVATLKQDPEAVGSMQQPTAETVATPNHDPRHRALPSAALNPATVRAEPEPAAPSAPAFVAADTVLYAKDSARLRAAPGTSADILTKLAADAPLRATARSTDRAWWRVSLADGRTGYVHRTAVSRHRLVKTKLPEPVPVVASAPAQPVPARSSQGLLSYMDDTMSWLADAAGRGSAPTAIRTER